MRYILALIAVSFAGVLTAQGTPGVTGTTIIHEPSASEVGPYISGIMVPNPDYTLNNGQPEQVPVYGNGKGLSNLDTVSGELYALAGTTTHDLLIITNATGAVITMNGVMTTLQVGAPRPKYDYAQAPENGQPGWVAGPVLYPYDNTSVSIGIGSSAAAILVVTRWMTSLDTSPRDYIIPIQFEDLASSTTMVVEVALTVPYTDNATGSGCCTLSKGGLPAGLLLIAGVALAAVLRRRRKVLS
ncbi:MAG: hypothetical protein L3J82_05990 [Planctomycetes bacterium]|nr:hypothetical protein [Planctomycetota bacterium]